MKTPDKAELTFGKYKGQTPEQISDHDPRYIVWLYDNLDTKFCTMSLRNACEESNVLPWDDEKEIDTILGYDGWGN